MIACKECGQQVSLQKSRNQLCATCYSDKRSIENEALIGMLTEKPAHCYAVVKNVITQLEPLKISMGDLFITSGGLAYIPYLTGQYAGEFGGSHGLILGGSRGFILGGGPAGIAVSYSVPQSLSKGKKIAHRCREEDYGMCLEDRLLKRSGFVIVRTDFRAAEVISNKILQIEYSKGTMAMAVHPSSIAYCLEQLKLWAAGLIKDSPDTQGINLHFPPAGQLLSDLQGGNINLLLQNQTLSRIPSEADYMKSLFSLFRHQNKNDQAQIMKTIYSLPSAFLNPFKDKLASERNCALRICAFTALGSIPGITSVVYLIGSTKTPYRPMTDFQAVASYLAIISLFSAILFVGSVKKYFRYEKLLRPQG